MHTTYMLRRTLCPWKIEALVAETVAFCRQSAVDEIVWITESSGMYRELLPIDEIERLIPGLEHAKKATEAAGMRYSINPLTTIGHGEYGNDLRTVHPGMDFMVDYTGRLSRACACPLSPVWRELMAATFGRYAQTGPVRLWIEDDFRYFNHGPVSLGCFCDLHLDAFSRYAGESYSRETLVARLLQPGQPAPERRVWMEFLGKTLTETAAFITQAVHAVSTDVQMGWMSTNGSLMELCGTDIGDMLRALANGRQAAIRMSSARFVENSWRDLYVVDENLKRVLPHVPRGTVKCIEVETFPHSLYSKSATGLCAQMTWAGILGAPNHTLNIFDYLGSPMDLIPRYRRMLADRKAEMESFARDAVDAETMRGIGLLSAPLMPSAVHAADGKSWHEWAVRENGWSTPLRAFGMPVVYDNHQAVTAVSGQALRAFDRAGLEALFSRGVLLDGSAVETLADMGFEKFAGVAIEGHVPAGSRPVGPEELIDPAFGGGHQAYVWASLLRPERILNPQPDCRVISRILDAEGNVMFPGFVLYENALGGRVASCPYDFGGTGLDPFVNREPEAFYSEYRKRQLQAVARWIGRGKVPLMVDAEGWVLPHRCDLPGAIRVAVMNLNADTWERVSMRVAASQAVRDIRWADVNGAWHRLRRQAWKQQAADVDVILDKILVPPLRVVAVHLEYEAAPSTGIPLHGQPALRTPSSQ